MKRPISVDDFRKLTPPKIDTRLYITVPFDCDNSKKSYVCSIEPLLNEGQFLASIAIIPLGYHVGALYSDNEPTELGREASKLAANFNLGVDFDKRAIYYCRRIVNQKDIVDQLSSFVRDAAKLVPVVDKMILDYISKNAA